MKTRLLSLLLFSTTVALGQSYVVDTEHPEQTIEHFGASDAWSMWRIGLWQEEEAQKQIADSTP